MASSVAGARSESSEERGKFFGEILNVLRQQVFGGVNDEHQQRVKQSRHGVPTNAGVNMLSDREIALFLYPAECSGTMTT